MDNMFIKYKNEFIASMNATIDMFQNSLDTMDLQKSHGADIDEDKYNEIKNNRNNLNRILLDYKTKGTINKKDEHLVVAAMGTVVIYLEYMSDNYKKAAEKAKIIIANIQSEN